MRGESPGERAPHLDEREGNQSESMRRKGWTLQRRRHIPSRRGQARRASLEEVEGSLGGRVDVKALQEDMQSLGFTPSLAKPEIGKEVGRRRARS